MMWKCYAKSLQFLCRKFFQYIALMPTKHLLIKGKVQGVFYRATAREVAEQLNITGWVKNTDEGHVEAMITGDDKQVEKFIAWCKKGPPKAVVTNIDVEDVAEEKTFQEFKIIRDR